MSKCPPLRLVVLISGSGSNLQSIIERCTEPGFDAEVVAVISNRPDVYGLKRAAKAGIAHALLDHTRFDGRESFDAALMKHIDQYRPDLVVLAGFMRILTGEFVRHYHGRLLNIHPSLLPKYQGLHTHRRALEAGDKTHGASVHFVTEELDGGPLILQAVVPILDGDDEATLAQRVLSQEHQIYPKVIEWLATGRLRYDPEQGPLLDEGQTTLPVVTQDD